MEVGVVLVSTTLVLIISFLLSALGVELFFSLLVIGFMLGALAHYTGFSAQELKKRLIKAQQPASLHTRS